MSDELTGDELHERAAELDIEGRSDMSADELRGAIAEKEAAQQPEQPAGGPGAVDPSDPASEPAPPPGQEPTAAAQEAMDAGPDPVEAEGTPANPAREEGESVPDTGTAD